jgi:choline dehydrogenase-like flavoprotein
MSDKINDVIVVGSGVSGAHAAQVMVEAGCDVVMLDVGYRDEKYSKLVPERPFSEIRRDDPQQHRYLLGDCFEGIDLMSPGADAHVTPPRKYVLRFPSQLGRTRSSSFAALESFSLGGLGSTWGAVSFPFTDSELLACGLTPSEIRPHYNAVAERIGVSGSERDDLSAVRGELRPLQPPPEIDGNASAIERTYERKRKRLLEAGIRMGRSLLAVLTESLGKREPTPYFDTDYLCNVGKSVYRPESTIEDLLKQPNFTYQRALVANFTEPSSGGVIVQAESLEDCKPLVLRSRVLILAAGALGSARIVLRTFEKYDRPVPLTCNSHVYVPCIMPRQLAKPANSRRHSLAQLTMVYDRTGDSRHLVQAQYYPYGSLLLYRLLKESPLPYRESLRILHAIESAFGIWLIQHEDHIQADKCATLKRESHDRDHLEIMFRLANVQISSQHRSERAIMRAMRQLGCWPLKRVHAISGSSAHYASTLPFSSEKEALTTDPSGRLHCTKAVFVADGAPFRYLPAKGPTLTLMANARRVASNALAHLD